MTRVIDSTMFRRSFLSLAAAAAGAAAFRRAIPQASAAEPAKVRADACILLWMNGGPSHLDTFDPKPGRAVMGPMRAIATSVPGLKLGEHLPLLAREAKSFAVCRGLSSKEGSHERARFLGHTGYSPNPTAAHPSLGAYASKNLGGRDPELPAYVSLAGPGGDAGFLGAAHAPFIVSAPGAAPDDTDPGVPAARFERRGRALAMLDDGFAKATSAPAVSERRAVYDRAFKLMRSPKLPAFDLADEPQATRTMYGDSSFGRGCLTARRLVEAGVRFVEVTLDGWDTHQDNFSRVKTQCGALDPALCGLLRDLESRALLDRTLVVCMGEFGRTPRISDDDGRDHHPAAFSALLAGGGVRGGSVVGQTDEDGEKVVEGRVAIADLFATLAVQLGMDPLGVSQTPGGRPVTLTDGGSAIEKLLAR